MSPSRPGRFTLLALVALLALLCFGTLEVRGLFWPDEGRYAEIAREMLASGDFVTPRLNGLKYFEKPPLQYWASAVAFGLFGPDEWTARLWPATCAFALVLATASAWWRWSGPDTGLVAGAVLAGESGFVLGGQILTLDMGLTLFLSLALLALVAAHRPGLAPEPRDRRITLAWAAMALAVLAKGLIGIVLPAITLAAYAALERDTAILRRAMRPRGIAVFLALALPWFVLVQRANPEFFDIFVVQEHLQRYTLPAHHRPGPWWYFLPILLLGLLPWTASLPAAIRDAWASPRDGALNVPRLLLVWSVVVVAFFSASKSKLPAYVLPAFPALAWLLALARPARRPRFADQAAIASLAAGFAYVAVALNLDRLPRLRELGSDLADYPWYLLAAGGALLLAGAVAWTRRRRASATARIVLLAAGGFAAMQVALTGTHAFDAYYSAERAIDTFVGEKGAFPREPPFYMVGELDQSVPFYLGRPVTLVAHRGELGSGIAAEPGKFIARRERFEELWRSQHEAYAVMSHDTYRELVAHGLPMNVMAADPRRVFVARGPWPPAPPATRAPGTPK